MPVEHRVIDVQEERVTDSRPGDTDSFYETLGRLLARRWRREQVSGDDPGRALLKSELACSSDG